MWSLWTRVREMVPALHLEATPQPPRCQGSFLGWYPGRRLVELESPGMFLRGICRVDRARQEVQTCTNRSHWRPIGTRTGRTSALSTAWGPEEGDADAQFNLGEMYDNGEGVPQESSSSTLWRGPRSSDSKRLPTGGARKWAENKDASRDYRSLVQRQRSPLLSIAPASPAAPPNCIRTPGTWEQIM